MKESIAVELDKTDVDLEDIANSPTVVHFSKVEAETGEELPGAVLELYAPDGSLLDTWETSDIPHVIPGLPVGEGYVLREVTAPEGFEVAEDVTLPCGGHHRNPDHHHGGRENARPARGT